MNMHQSLTTMDLVVFVALAMALAFVAAWCLSPALRTWMERPKYRFQQNLQSYDEAAGIPHPRKERL